jgi:hypothetical protein
MTAVQFRTVHLLVYSCLVCADLLKISGKHTKDNFAQFCSSHIMADYAKAREVLGLTKEDTCSIMHTIIHKLFASLSKLKMGPILTEKDREIWEDQFCTNI